MDSRYRCRQGGKKRKWAQQIISLLVWPKSFLGGTDLSTDVDWDNTPLLLLQANELWTLRKISGLNYRQFGDRFKSFQQLIRRSHLSHSLRATTTVCIPQTRWESSASREISPAGRSSQSTRSDSFALISPELIREMSGEIYGRVKGNEWEPRPISAKTAPVSTNRAVNFGYRAFLLFCQRTVWWKNRQKFGWRLHFVFLASTKAPQLWNCLKCIANSI